jgi:beta-phosphoglucomutase
MIKAVLMDLDGTLVELKESHYLALNKALKEVVNYEIPHNLHLLYYDGKTTNTKLKILENRGIVEEKHKKLIWELKQKYTMDFIEMFDIDYVKVDMMKKLKSDEYNLVCISNSIIATVKKILEVIGILDYFDIILGNEHFKSKPKPDPYPYLLAFELLKLNPKECIALEDNFNGIYSAKKSGCWVYEVEEVKEVNYKNVKKKIIEFDNLIERSIK